MYYDAIAGRQTLSWIAGPAMYSFDLVNNCSSCFSISLIACAHVHERVRGH